jgi:hypothetical protein
MLLRLVAAVTQARTQGQLWVPSADRNKPGIVHCVLNTQATNIIGTVVKDRKKGTRKDTNKLRIVAQSVPPYAIITMFPR